MPAPDFNLDDRRLDAAVSLGIISAEQAAQIRAIASPRPAPPPGGAPHPVGASVLAYAIGAITVLIAMGWFLADRWESLTEGVVALLTVALVPLAVIALSELLPWFPQMPGRS